MESTTSSSRAGGRVRVAWVIGRTREYAVRLARGKDRKGSAAAVRTREVAVRRRKRPTQRSEERLELAQLFAR